MYDGFYERKVGVVGAPQVAAHGGEGLVEAELTEFAPFLRGEMRCETEDDSQVVVHLARGTEGLAGVRLGESRHEFGALEALIAEDVNGEIGSAGGREVESAAVQFL